MAIDLTADFTSKRDRLLWQRMEKAHSVSASIDRELVGSLAEYRCNKPFPDRKVMQRALAGGLARDRQPNRYQRDRLVSDRDASLIPAKFKGVFSFFGKIEQEEIIVHVPDLVVFQSFFVLTSYYDVPASVAADKLSALMSFRGIRMTHKHIMLDCLARVRNHADDLVDAWLVAWSKLTFRTSVDRFPANFQTRFSVENAPSI